MGSLFFDVVAREDTLGAVLGLALPPALVPEFVNVGDPLTLYKGCSAGMRKEKKKVNGRLRELRGQVGGGVPVNVLSSPSSAASYSYSATATMPSSTVAQDLFSSIAGNIL